MILANSSAGLYDFRNELVQALLQEHKVVVSLPDEVKTKELEEEGCEVVRTQLSRRGTNPVKDLALLARYRKLLRKYKPDLVLTYTIKPNVYGGMACAAAGIPYIATVTGLGSAFEKGGLHERRVNALPAGTEEGLLRHVPERREPGTVPAQRHGERPVPPRDGLRRQPRDPLV